MPSCPALVEGSAFGPLSCVKTRFVWHQEGGSHRIIWSFVCLRKLWACMYAVCYPCSAHLILVSDVLLRSSYISKFMAPSLTLSAFTEPGCTQTAFIFSSNQLSCVCEGNYSVIAALRYLKTLLNKSGQCKGSVIGHIIPTGYTVCK